MEDFQNIPSIPTIFFVSILPFSTHGTHELLLAITHAAYRYMLFSLHGTARPSARLHNRPAGEMLDHDIVRTLLTYSCSARLRFSSLATTKVQYSSAFFRVLHKLYDAGVHENVYYSFDI